MFPRLILYVLYAFSITDVRLCSKESDAIYRNIQKLYQQTAPDNMSCWFHWHEDTKKACYDKQLVKKHELLAAVKDAWLVKGIIAPIDECKGGYAQFNIGVQFNGPVLLPCDEHAFDAPKHTDEEITAKYYELKKLWNDYDSICVQMLTNENCAERKWNKGQKLAKAIEKAEKEEYIPKNCKPDGIGAYSFNQGMDPTDMPCKPMPDGTKYGDPGTITAEKS